MLEIEKNVTFGQLYLTQGPDGAQTHFRIPFMRFDAFKARAGLTQAHLKALDRGETLKLNLNIEDYRDLEA